MVAAVDSAQVSLKTMAECIPITDATPTKRLRENRKAFEECFEGLKTAFEMYQAAQDFFTASTLAKIADWTKRYAVTKHRHSWDGNRLGDKDGYRPGFEVPPPFADLSSEPLDLIEEYRRAD
jgi:hypothetical protein